MLSKLYIKNLAIIDELEISFVNGLNIITGETGSGKSLLIKAISLLMGAQFTEELLRSGESKLIIEATFVNSKQETQIKRVYNKSGRTKSFINNDTVSLKQLLIVTRELADLHGQYDHQNLLNPDTHIEYLDLFGNYKDDIKKYKTTFNNMRECNFKLKEKEEFKKEYENNKELNDFQIKELLLLPLSEAYCEDLSKKHKILSNSIFIQESFSKIISILEDGNSSIIKNILKMSNEFDKVYQYDNSISYINEQIADYRLNFENILQEVQQLKNNMVVDEKELIILNDNVSHIEMLKRKYGGSINSVIKFRDELVKTSKISKDWDNQINKLRRQLKKINLKLHDDSLLISNKRKKTAEKLKKVILKKLNNLNMPETQFHINIVSDSSKITENGIDTCEYFISTNIGERLKPVSKIASGGEISRIMLAIKIALRSNDIVKTLIFDEIDSGISGETANKVGLSIEELSKSHQILCITHLSQIATKGNTHYKVNKKIINNRITVEVNKLSDKSRINEIAKLISADEITQASKTQAQELLQING